MPKIPSFRKAYGWVVVGVFLAFFFSQLGFAQGSYGEILGSVTDPSGAAIPGAAVTITNPATNVSRNLTTDTSGNYVAPELRIGTYTIRVTAKGFKTTERSGVDLQLGENLRVNFKLQVGSQVQTVTVTGQVPIMQTTSATLGGVVNNTTLNSIPLMGRNYQNLVGLRPGSTFYPGGGGWTQTTNGGRPTDNGYIMEGLTNDKDLTGLTVINGSGVEGDAATIMPLDAIREFRIMQNPPVQYGGKASIVSVGLKSGTNQVHGTAYAFGRTDAFDARNYFNNKIRNGQCISIGPQPASTCAKTPIQLEQWGATAGGPLIKNKLFWFVGYEAKHYTVGDLIPQTVPQTLPQTPFAPGASFPDAIVALENAGITPAALSMHLAGCTQSSPTSVPVCNGGLYGNNTGSSNTFEDSYTSTFQSDNGMAKFDYHANEKNTISGMVFIGRSNIVAPDVGFPFSETNPQFLTTQFQRPLLIEGNWIFTPNSNWVNTFRFGYTHDVGRDTSADTYSKVPATHYGINTGVTNPLTLGMPNIIIGGYTSLGGFIGWPIHFGPINMTQATDNVSFLHGNHQLFFGFDIHYQNATFGRFTQGRGFVLFGGGNINVGSSPASPLEDFMAGAPTLGRVLAGANLIHLHDWLYATYFSDTWRTTPRLTLNLGVRWDYQSPLAEQHNLLGNFDPNAAPGVFPLQQVGQQLNTAYNDGLSNFAPRLGLAWDIFGNGKTVIHAGYGIVYDSQLPFFEFVGNAFGANAQTLGIEAIPAGAQFQVNGITSRPCTTCTVKYGITEQTGVGAAWRSQPGDGTGTPLFSNTNSAVCGDGLPGTGDAGPCSIEAAARNFKTPFIATWTFGIQHAFTNNLSLNVAYVGNHGARLPSVLDINQINPASFGESGLPGSTCYNLGAGPHCEANADRPYGAKYPYLQIINMIGNLYSSNYNGLQVSATQRLSHGLSFLLGYTYSHALAYQGFNIDEPTPQNSFNPYAEYSTSTWDIKHRFTLAITYNIPGVNGFGQVLKGWQVNSIITLQSGLPWGAIDTSNDPSATSEFMDRWNFFGNAKDFQSTNHSIPYCSGTFGASPSVSCTETTPAGLQTLSGSQTSAFETMCYNAAAKVPDGPLVGAGLPGVPADTATTGVQALDSLGCFAQGGSVMVPPALGSFGTMSRMPFRDGGLRDWDFSVTKTFRIHERVSTEFRAEIFNVLNHPSFTNPWGASNGFAHNDPSSPGNFGCGCETPDLAAGNPIIGAGGNRAMQLGLKIIF